MIFTRRIFGTLIRGALGLIVAKGKRCRYVLDYMVVG
jgi:hypothetical protein